MARLQRLSGEAPLSFEIERDKTLIGRHPVSDLRCPSTTVSGRHAVLIRDGDAYFIEDLGSRNGTTVNGREISSRTRLTHGDRIDIAHSAAFRFVLDAAQDHLLTNTTRPRRVSFSDDTPRSGIKSSISGEGRFGRLDSQVEAKLEAVLEISTALAGVVDFGAIPQRILECLFRIFPGADRGCILLKNRETGEMNVGAVRHRRDDASVSMQLSRTIINKVLTERTSILCEDVNEDHDFELSPSLASLAIRSFMCVPMLGLDGEPMGLIDIESLDRPIEWRQEDLDLLIAVAGQAALSYESARLRDDTLRLERRQAKLGQFFSPRVLKTLSLDDAEQYLDPRVLDVTVLFCDIRGFSRRAERNKHELPELLERCSQALGIMSRRILDAGGVISDFQGDAALGFWGWPVPTEDGPLPACRTALAIYEDFAAASQQPGHPLEDFQIGIGIAHGPSIAGRIGSDVQWKIGVFGPVVNLGSRLEGLTKELRVPILLDEATFQVAREQLPPDVARLRKLGLIRPFGMDSPVMVGQLLPPESRFPLISDEDIAQFEQAVDAIQQGDWNRGIELLDHLPVEDRAKDFLLRLTAEFDFQPPDEWDGVFSMDHK